MAHVERLPVFVYGTLRRGQGNHRLLAGRVLDEHEGVLKGHALCVRGVPYVVEAVGSQVIGDVIVIDPDVYDKTLDDLDRLEGYRLGRVGNHYERVRRQVRLCSEVRAMPSLEAWVYLAGAEVRAALGETDRVLSGNWLNPSAREGVR